MSEAVSRRKSAPKNRKSAPRDSKSALRAKMIASKSAPKTRARKPGKRLQPVVGSLGPGVVVLEQLAGRLRRDALAGTRPVTTSVELKRGLQAVLALMDVYPDSPVLEP
jgi:hypothetical protein